MVLSKLEAKESCTTRVVRFTDGVSHKTIRGSSGLVCGREWEYALPALPIQFEKILSRLPVPTAFLMDEASNAGHDAIELLQKMRNLSALEEVVFDTDREEAILVKHPRLVAFNPFDDDQKTHVGNDVFLRFEHNKCLLLSTTSNTVVYMQVPYVEKLFQELVEPKRVKELSTVGRLLLDNGFLSVAKDQDNDPWVFHDALFHAVSVHGDGTEGGYGATWAGARKARSSKGQTVRKSLASYHVALPKNETPSDVKFNDVLSRRRTCRNYAATPLAFEDLGCLLDMSLRTQFEKHLQNGARIAFHPYPSGGACNEITTMIARHGNDKTGSYLAMYDNRHHSLDCFKDSARHVVEIMNRLGAVGDVKAPPSAALLFIADYAKMAEKYEAIPYAVILRNIGAIYQTVSLAAESLHMASCALGGGWGFIEKHILPEYIPGQAMVGGMLLGWPAENP